MILVYIEDLLIGVDDIEYIAKGIGWWIHIERTGEIRSFLGFEVARILVDIIVMSVGLLNYIATNFLFQKNQALYGSWRDYKTLWGF